MGDCISENDRVNMEGIASSRRISFQNLLQHIAESLAVDPQTPLGVREAPTSAVLVAKEMADLPQAHETTKPPYGTTLSNTC